jgi:cyclopropane-fatty-acyl-phospholipid synthase
MVALNISQKVRTPPYIGPMLFNLSGFLLNQIIRDSYLTITCISPYMQMNVGRLTGEAFSITVVNPETIWEIVTNPDPGAGELFMDGKWRMDRGDIGAFITMMARNFQNLLDSPASFLLSAFLKKKLQKRARNVEKSRDYVQHHYDIGNDLYESFLDSGMNYSCAFFENPGMSLRNAQLNKIRTTIRRLDIRSGMRVLDIGCGWGEACRVVAEENAAHVTGITLADRQLGVAREKAKTLHHPPSYFLEDYREHAARNPGAYDRIFSIGMFEHVGEDNYRPFFAAVRDQLAPGGKALIHSIMNASRPSEKLMNSPWLERYIFPGGRIPDLPEMIKAAEQEGLHLAHSPYLQPPSDYAETLRRWRKNFHENMYRLDQQKYDMRFRRMWIYYLAMCEAMFEGCGCQVGQVVFQK